MRWKKVRVLPSPGVSVGISMGGDLLELTVSSQDMPREELMEILSRYDRKRKFYRLKNGDFVNMEENGLESLQEVRQALQLTDKQLMQDKIEVPAYRMLYLDETLQENAMMEVIRDVSFASRIEKLQNPDFEKEYVPDSLKGILREYQKAGAAWIGSALQQPVRRNSGGRYGAWKNAAGHQLPIDRAHRMQPDRLPGVTCL